MDAVDGPIDGDSIVGNGIGETWDEAGGSSNKVLAESFLLGSSVFGNGRVETLGNAFQIGGDTDSLSFQYRSATNGALLNGMIEVVTGGGVAGDYNGDGVVNTADYTVWRDNLGQNITLPNEDPGTTPGMVTVEDYTFWQSRFGANSGSGTSNVAVPEPASGLLLTLLALLSLGQSRRTK